MAVQIDDSKTPQLPGLPEAKRRGRPCKGDKPMTPAERMASSRYNRQKVAAKKVKSGDMNAIYPVPFSCEVDVMTRQKLNKLAKARGFTVGQLLDEICSNL